jgi:hypothetical protein
VGDTPYLPASLREALQAGGVDYKQDLAHSKHLRRSHVKG